MGHESLTQFLELYAYNVTRTGPPFGMPLPQDARAAIIDRAPAALRAEVAALVERIGT